MKIITDTYQLLKFITKVFLIWITTFSSFGSEVRNIDMYNLDSTGTGLIDRETSRAFDPVAYFPEGGGHPKQGSSEFSVIYLGVEYLFSSQENAKLFLANPKKYEPAYGGWAARGMVVGARLLVKAQHFLVHEDCLFLFSSDRSKRSFARQINKSIQEADTNWKKINSPL